jgi:general stress protein 26
MNADVESGGVIETAVDIAHQTVWGVMTTVDARGRPRNRVVHPVWVWDGGRLTGWLTTRRTPLKVRHLAGNPHVSLAYIGANTDFAYFDCTAEWVEDMAGKQACWDAFVNAEDPVRYDPANIWKDGPGSGTFAVLRFTPYRVQAARASDIAKGIPPGLVRLG